MKRVIIRVIADFNKGEANIEQTQMFLDSELHPVIKMDYLQDALYQIKDLYEKINQEYYDGMTERKRLRLLEEAKQGETNVQ
jgi:hypothetical protein